MQEAQAVNPYEEKTSARGWGEGTRPFCFQRQLRSLLTEKYSVQENSIALHCSVRWSVF